MLSADDNIVKTSVKPGDGKPGDIYDAKILENPEQTGRTPLHKALRIDPRRLMSKLLDVLNVRPRINSRIAVGAAFTAQFQHT
jgi:hypothetical protein